MQIHMNFNVMERLHEIPKLKNDAKISKTCYRVNETDPQGIASNFNEYLSNIRV